MNDYTRRNLRNRKRRIEDRLGDRHWSNQAEPMFSASNIHYQMGERQRGTAVGGIGTMHLVAKRTGLIEAINKDVQVLKRHLPYHESDHVLNIAYNGLSGGTCMEDIELRRKDEVYLDALGAQRIPDPTTAGDFCRRFEDDDVESLMDTFNEVRLGVWRQQPDFAEAVLDADGTLAPTSGECKDGMDVAYDGTWGYHPLVISLANTAEPLYLVNRSGNRPSHEGAAKRFDQAIGLCQRAGFRQILLRGDTDFSQTRHLDGWDDQGVEFIFGINAMKNMVDRADQLEPDCWAPLERGAKDEVATQPRERPDQVKERIVRERGYKNIRLQDEDVAEFRYRPGACDRDYRVVVVRKNLSVAKGEQVLFDDIRYFFYITNRADPADQIGISSRNSSTACTPWGWHGHGVAGLEKAWFALLLPETGRWGPKHRAEKDQDIPERVHAPTRTAPGAGSSFGSWPGTRGCHVLRQPLRCTPWI